MFEVPPTPLQETDPLEALRERHREDGLDIDPSKDILWEGDPMDLAWTMGAIYEPPPPPPPPDEGLASADP